MTNTPSPEHNDDPIRRYNDLMSARAALDIQTFADETIAGLYADVAADLDRQIAEITVPLADAAIAEGTTAATALTQLEVLERVARGETLDRIAETRTKYTERVHAAAELLTKLEVSDPRMEQILAAAGMAGAVAVVATEEQTPPPATPTPSPAAEPVPPAEQQATIDPDTVRIKLAAYMRTLAPGTTEQLPPGDLWSKVAPGVPYVSIRHKPIITEAIGNLKDENLVVGYNNEAGRAALYTLEARAVQPPQETRAEPSPIPPELIEASTKADSEFDIDKYFSVNDALILATLLAKFNDHLAQSDLTPLNTDILASILATPNVGVEILSSEEKIRQARADTLAKIEALYQNDALLEQIIDNLPEDDVRYPVFEYLFNFINAETYPQFAELLALHKTSLENIRLVRFQGKNVLDIAGEIFIPDSQSNAAPQPTSTTPTRLTERDADKIHPPRLRLPKEFPTPVECVVLLNEYSLKPDAKESLPPVEFFRILLPEVQYDTNNNSHSLKIFTNTYLAGISHSGTAGRTRYSISHDTPVGIKANAEAVDPDRLLPMWLATELADFLYRFRDHLLLKGFRGQLDSRILEDIKEAWPPAKKRTGADAVALARGITFLKGYETFGDVENIFPADPRKPLLQLLKEVIDIDTLEILVDLHDKVKDHLADSPPGPRFTGDEFVRDQGSFFS